ncbi:MAG TPA: DUF6062 family protein [Anaerolineales bacterium]|nr:DUF6062 family protein [Anaerolineales bacterium]
MEYLIHEVNATITVLDLITACQKPGCPICRLQQETVEQYLRDLFEKYFHRTDIRAVLRDSKGFCKEHGWLAFELELGGTFGAGIIYHDLLMLAIGDLQKVKSTPSDKSLWSLSDRILRRLGLCRIMAASTGIPPRCPACIEQEVATHAALGVLTSNLNDAVLNAVFRKSTGLCRQHLNQAIARSPNAEITRALVSISGEKLEALRVRVTEYIRETEHKTPEQIHSVEKSFWPQVVGAISGYGRISKE